MFLFRLLGFMMRLIASFFFVFLLQIPFKGRTLETYLNQFGQKFFVTKTLQKVSDNGVKIISQWNSGEKVEGREIANKKAKKLLKEFSKKLPQSYQEPDSEEEEQR